MTRDKTAQAIIGGSYHRYHFCRDLGSRHRCSHGVPADCVGKGARVCRLKGAGVCRLKGAGVCRLSPEGCGRLSPEGCGRLSSTRSLPLLKIMGEFALLMVELDLAPLSSGQIRRASDPLSSEQIPESSVDQDFHSVAPPVEFHDQGPWLHGHCAVCARRCRASCPRMSADILGTR